MPRNYAPLVRNEQPLNWKRAFWSGVLGVTFMMAFIDIFNMLGLTQYSFEMYVGSILAWTPYKHHIWLLGLLANWVIGGIFGIFYGYCFEYWLRRADGRTGAMLGLAHAVLAAAAVFPFFGAIHEFMGTGLYPSFGILGSRLDPGTPILLIAAHLLFGTTMGTFYGPVRVNRVQMREFEPGESGMPGDRDVITDEEDHEERVAV